MLFAWTLLAVSSAEEQSILENAVASTADDRSDGAGPNAYLNDLKFRPSA